MIKVTNLNDSGPGSLRDCVQTRSGPRTCVFAVGGRIDLLSTLHVHNPHLTVAGQTAPGGIAIYTGLGMPVSGQGLKAFSVEAPDVIIRYVRIWGQAVVGEGPAPARGSIAVMTYAPDVIIDHVTALWQTGFTFGGNVGSAGKPGANYTLQWSIGGENVHNGSVYKKGQSTPLLFLAGRSAHYDPAGVTDVDCHHNLFANASHRFPGLAVATGRFVNNAVFNWRRASYEDVGDSTGTAGLVDFIGNDYKAGNMPKSAGVAGYREIMANRANPVADVSLFVSGNRSDWSGWDVTPGDRGTVPAGSSDAFQWSKLTAGSTVYQGAASAGLLPLPSSYKRSPYARLPPPASGIDIPVDSVTSLPSLLTAQAGAGASRFLNCDGTWTNFRDSAETRIIGSYLNGSPTPPSTVASYANYASSASVSNLPVLTPRTPCTDTDGDGMPDIYETAHGLDPNDPTDGPRVQADGYTNLEHYLDGR
ncbi:thrombospondin type 3 repeat-containing protein [Anaeromyxobacter oryzisoli]|uniref:thrombospondin type 3 repeat-containing protein n=1 Tax=Anaeromyxobacter oryzisoli TaxID=2925408 RepID=UPI001F57CDE1|nr:thrombospondin type 3 repeat-containing protein [Anaeromyxobacter sp. SG63]